MTGVTGVALARLASCVPEGGSVIVLSEQNRNTAILCELKASAPASTGHALVTGVNIRPMQPVDLPAVYAVYAASKLDELQNEIRIPELIPLPNDPRRLADFLRSCTWVAEAGEELLGYVSQHGQNITALFVLPSARGMGLGRTLLRHVLSLYRGTTFLQVAASNEAAFRLYQQHGFHELRRFMASYNQVPIEAITMERPASD